jgi:zinc D-Ala-D-Ala carboxypeptidase
MKLSNNFSLSEFTASPTADRLGIDNTPNKEVTDNLQELVTFVLQPIRDRYGSVVISSGYRSPELNKAIGGSTTSDHCLGCAADFEVQGMDNKEMAKWIANNLDFKQVILEFYHEGDMHSGWIHCSYKKDNNKKQKLNALKDGKKTIYTQGKW